MPTSSVFGQANVLAVHCEVAIVGGVKRSNVVFINDNPVERASVAASFQEKRVVDANPYVLKGMLVRRTMELCSNGRVPQIGGELFF